MDGVTDIAEIIDDPEASRFTYTADGHVAELRYRDEQRFWTGDASLQDSVFTAFAATGSRIVVAAHAPVTAVKEGWIRLGNTDYYARSLLAKPQPMRRLARSESLP